MLSYSAYYTTERAADVSSSDSNLNRPQLPLKLDLTLDLIVSLKDHDF